MNNTPEPTVLGMINRNLNDISIDVKEIKADIKAGAVKMENHDVRLGNIEICQKELKDDFQHHVTNKKKHYNQGYEDTVLKRLSRRKIEISIGTIIATVITILINHYGG